MEMVEEGTEKEVSLTEEIVEETETEDEDEAGAVDLSCFVGSGSVAVETNMEEVFFFGVSNEDEGLSMGSPMKLS
jgi:hypothetical protein